MIEQPTLRGLLDRKALRRLAIPGYLPSKTGSCSDVVPQKCARIEAGSTLSRGAGRAFLTTELHLIPLLVKVLDPSVRLPATSSREALTETSDRLPGNCAGTLTDTLKVPTVFAW